MTENIIFYSVCLFFSLLLVIEGILNKATASRCIKAVTGAFIAYMALVLISFKPASQNIFSHMISSLDIMVIKNDDSFYGSRRIGFHFIITLIFVSQLILLAFTIKPKALKNGT